MINFYYIGGVLYELQEQSLVPADTIMWCSRCGQRSYAFDQRALCFICLSHGCKNSGPVVCERRDMPQILLESIRVKRENGQLKSRIEALELKHEELASLSESYARLRKELEGRGGCKILSQGDDCKCPLCDLCRLWQAVGPKLK